MEMEKRTQTISARVTVELERQLQGIALAHDTTLSDLVYRALQDLAETERSRYLKLRSAFEGEQDLSGLRHDA
jgi:predicted transcriptional regulator